MLTEARSETSGNAAQAPGESAAPYWEATREPLTCLVFLFPLVAAYETGALLLRPETWPEQRLVAQRLIQQLIAWLGPDAVWVPGVALLLTLVIWQLVFRRPWRVRARVPLLMIVESLVLTVPLFVLGRLLQQTTATAGAESLRVHIVLGLGAGVYEELVFRFYLITGLRHLLAGGCRVPGRALDAAVRAKLGGRCATDAALQRPPCQGRAATIVAAVLAALIFAACHLRPIGSEAFAWSRFLVLTAAGGYLSIVFVLRGLGVCTGCHAAYNVIALALGAG